MPDKDASTPRVFLIRHGTTAWSESGQYTGKSDIPLTANGEKQVSNTAGLVFGPGRLIDPSKLARVYISPRTRAQRTFDLLCGASKAREALTAEGKVETTESLAEWNYGAYEGLLTAEIRAKRKAKNLDQERAWDIWIDGCEDGESAQEVSFRIDSLITSIRDIQSPHMKDSVDADVLLVAHGHLLRAFAKRWLEYPLDFPLSLMMEPGGVGVLSYQHGSVKEPALLLGIGFPASS